MPAPRQIEAMDAVVVRALITALHDQTAATRALAECVGRLCDKVDRLAGHEPDDPPHAFGPGAMGLNGR